MARLGYAAICSLLLSLLVSACDRTPADTFQGYAEGEFVYVASQLAGRLDELPLMRGDKVIPGQRLFVLEHDTETIGVERAQATLQKAQNTLADLKKGLRPDEIDQILARIAKSEAELSLAKIEMERRQRLLASGAVAKEEYDKARTAFLASQGSLADLKAQLATGKLGSRIDQILAATDQVAAARADFDQARWSLDQKMPLAILDAQVVDLLYYRGEWVSAGSPVVKLLPPDAVKVRFFVPETEWGRLKVGQAVSVRADGLDKPLAGHISFVNTQVEYTPPIIYSQNFRAKLVVMVEARFAPQEAALLKPGQPVDVHLENGR